MLAHYAMHAVFYIGVLYGTIGLALGDALLTRLPFNAHAARFMVMVAWPTLGFGLVTEGEKRP